MFGMKKASGPVEYLIVGLGNPDKKYENTRHNCGWLALDYIADKRGCKVNKIKYKSFVGECTIAGKRVMLMKPTTYMNNSGQAVTEAMRFYKLPPENVIVIFDDVSLDVGKMRIRQKGSDGGQKGMRTEGQRRRSEGYAQHHLPQRSGYLSAHQDRDRRKAGSPVGARRLGALPVLQGGDADLGNHVR